MNRRGAEDAKNAQRSPPLESVYEACLAYELRERGFLVECQRSQPLKYKRLTVDGAYRVDLVVQDGSGAEVFVELKAIEKLPPVHEAQLLTHLKLSGRQLGLLMNFNVELLKDGRRLVNGFPDEILCVGSASSAPLR